MCSTHNPSISLSYFFVVALGFTLGLWGCQSAGKDTPVSSVDAPTPPGGGGSGQGAAPPIDVPGVGAGGSVIVPVGGSGPSEPVSDLRIVPSDPVITITLGQPVPPVPFELLRDGVRVTAPRWVVQDADLGAMSEDGAFTPGGDVGGATTIHAYVGDRRASTTLTVYLISEDNGGINNGSANAPGGYDGVGGEGPGGPVTDAVRGVLDGTPVADSSLEFLYPYDETVFPLGLFSPLLMWSASEASNADAVRVRMKGKYSEYHGYFTRPAALAGGQPFVRHPIPQEAWKIATRSNRGGELNIEVTLAVGDRAYGPIQRRLLIASGSLKGTVYYQSYGTSLADNYDRPGVGGPFGAATLAIRPGEIEPRLVAGQDDCRVCHTVSSQGQLLVTQRGARSRTSSYDLLNDGAETQYAQENVLAWIGLSPDGSLGLGNTRPLGIENEGDVETRLYDMRTGDPVATTGLHEFVKEASFPAFSHSGTQVAFNFESGQGNSTVGPGDGHKLVTMRFDATTRTFSDPKLAYSGDLPPGWPSFSPDENTIVFQREIKRGAHGYFESRSGGQGDLWWANLTTGEAHPLRRLNGDGYLPSLPETDHASDEVLNYEPTVSPIATGGYAWVVFMSRRLYGNVATSPPWQSDPRTYDHTKIITTKKLWVAAIDLNLPDVQGQSTAKMDISHPPFYLPGQELHAGNSRGFWVQDPCKPDGASCESGVECCSGTCQADLDTGEPTCGPKVPGCVAELNRCQQTEDCCDPALQCINAICTRPSPEPEVR
jgi:hypothetical protein